MDHANPAKKYFDLHLTGLGYLSRVREVNSAGNGRAKARPFLACSIAAFHGDPEVQNGIVYLNLDLIVSGEKARDAILSVMNDANDRDVKVLVGFRAGDHYISTYEIRQGDRAGQMGTVLKGRLLKIFWIKVDGVFVYQDTPHEDPPEDPADNADEVVFPDGHQQLDARATDDAGVDAPIRRFSGLNLDRIAPTLHARRNTLPGIAAGPASCDVLSVGPALRPEVWLLTVAPLRARSLLVIVVSFVHCEIEKII